MKENARKWSQLELEQYVLRELNQSSTQMLEDDLNTNPDLAKILNEITLSNRDILQRYRPNQVRMLVNNKVAALEKAPVNHAPTFIYGLGMAVTIILVFTVSGLIHQQSPDSGAGSVGGYDSDVSRGIRTKGLKPTLTIHRMLGKKIETLAEDSVARNNDIVQLSYNAAGWKHGAIISIDGRGVITLHFPSKIGDSTALTQDRLVNLVNGYQLDDSPDYEKFMFFAARAEFDVGILVKKLRDNKSIKNVEEIPFPVAGEFVVTSINLKKEVFE